MAKVACTVSQTFGQYLVGIRCCVPGHHPLPQTVGLFSCVPGTVPDSGVGQTVFVVWWEKLMVNELGLRIAEKYTVQYRVFPCCIRESACELTFQFKKDLPKEVAFC